jgi:heme exporter protein B
MPETSLIAAFFRLLKRDLVIAYRSRAEIANPLIFFVIIVTLFPLGVGADPGVLQILAPGVIWVAALLASLLSLDHLFRSDFEDGTLEQILMSPHPLSLLVLAKVLAHWLVTGLPLLVLSPLLGVLLSLREGATAALLATLALGTPMLSLIGAIGVALTVGLRRGGVLLSLLILPLYIPILIFAAGAVDAAGHGLPITGHLLFLASLLVLAITLTPWAIAAAPRISLD